MNGKQKPVSDFGLGFHELDINSFQSDTHVKMDEKVPDKIHHGIEKQYNQIVKRNSSLQTYIQGSKVINHRKQPPLNEIQEARETTSFLESTYLEAPTLIMTL